MRRLWMVLAAVAVILAAASWLSACGGGSSNTSSSPAASSEPLPTYQPSEEVSTTSSSYSTTQVLTTSDPVDEVGTFYTEALEQEGWETVDSHSTPGYSTYLRARRDGEEATIQISYAGQGRTLVSITTVSG